MKCVRRDARATWSKLVEAVPVEPAKAFSHDALLLAALSGDGGAKGDEFAELLVQKSLLWLVRRFAEDDEDSEETTRSMEVLTKLLDRRPSLMERLAHLAGPVLTAGISRRLKSLRHAKFLCRLLELTPLEMNVRQKHLVDILCYREALNDDRVQREIISTTTDCLGRESRSATLLVLKELSRSYTGSLSFKDRQILECVLKFEGRSESSVELLSLWQSDADAPVRSGSTNSAALDTLDVNRVLDTCLHFPRNRSYRDLRRDGFDECVTNRQKIAGQIYDPLFVLSVLGQFLAQEKVVTGFEMIDLLRTNALGCAVCCLSSRCALVRSAALALLCKAYAFVHAATFHEKEQLLLVFETLRNSAGVDLVAHDCSLINPLPLTATLFVAHALRAQAQPSLYLYPLISRFMLQRATPLDRTDVPLLYSFLYASSQQSQTHRQQRIFIIRFMTSCLLYGGRTEWRTMKRRHVWHSLAAMYTTLLMRDNDQSGGGEQNLRRSIEEYWEAAMLREHAAIDVVARLGFLQYLQQTLVARDGDGADASLVSCQIRIIASLIGNCDIAKLEKATGGTIFDSLRELLIKLHGVKSPIPTTLEQLLLPSRAAKKLSDHIKGMTSQDVGSNSACRCLSRWIDLIDQRVPLYQTTIEDRDQELLNEINRLLKYSRSVLDSQGADTTSDEGPLQ